jgi:TPR repeat protein/ATP-dependent protease ClpP protease subunit
MKYVILLTLFLAGEASSLDFDRTFAMAISGDALHQVIVSEMYESGIGGAPQSKFMALEFLIMAAKQGNPKHQLKLSAAFGLGSLGIQNPFQALHWARKAAKQGDIEAMLMTVLYLSDEQFELYDKNESLTWLVKAAEKSDDGTSRSSRARAQYLLGIRYEKGDGVKENYSEALRLFKLAGNNGDDFAQYSLGRVYYKGKGVVENFAKSASWYEKSAKQGNPWAQADLSGLYITGQGVEIDFVKAYAWGLLAKAKGENVANWDFLLTKVTTSQVNEAQALAQKYQQLEKWEIKTFNIDRLVVTSQSLRNNDCFFGAQHIFNLEGEIGPDSSFAMKELLSNYDSCRDASLSIIAPIEVSLESGGGFLKDGYELGRVFREQGVTTVIKEDTVCASSCAIAFLGGKKRVVEDSASILLHAPYSLKINSKGEKALACDESKKGHRALREYYVSMTDLEYGDRLFNRTMKYCSADDGWRVTGSDAAKLYGISYTE